MIDAMLAQSGVIESFEQLAAVGTVPLATEPVVQFADLEFETASGRIEIASASARATWCGSRTRLARSSWR
jgi:hypothetical protein